MGNDIIFGFISGMQFSVFCMKFVHHCMKPLDRFAAAFERFRIDLYVSQKFSERKIVECFRAQTHDLRKHPQCIFQTVQSGKDLCLGINSFVLCGQIRYTSFTSADNGFRPFFGFLTDPVVMLPQNILPIDINESQIVRVGKVVCHFTVKWRQCVVGTLTK